MPKKIKRRDFLKATAVGGAGFAIGDQLISINGVKPRDLIDYKFLIAEENIQLIVLEKVGL